MVVGADSPVALRFIFPSNLLYGILAELVENARASAPGRRAVLVQWSSRGDRFECEVHDDGPGIDRRLGARFAPLDGLGLPYDAVERGEARGLSIIERVLIKSGGGLLFSNSPSLGGTLVRFDFPVIVLK